MPQKSICLVWLLLCTSLYSFCQPIKIRGRILDAENGVPIAYATIIIKNQPAGTFSNEIGHFELAVPGKSDTIEISSVGYATSVQPITQEADLGEIRLRRKNPELQSVQLLAFSGKTTAIGHCPKRHQNAVNIYPGAEYVYRFIQKMQNPKRIVQLRCHVRKNSNTQRAVYRVNLYRIDKNGLPGNLVNKRDLVIESDGTSDTLIAQLYSDSYYLEKEGLFIGIESIGYIDKNGLYTDKNSVTPVYFKFGTDASTLPSCYRRINKFAWHPVKEHMSKNPDDKNLVPCFELVLAL